MPEMNIEDAATELRRRKWRNFSDWNVYYISQEIVRARGGRSGGIWIVQLDAPDAIALARGFLAQDRVAELETEIKAITEKGKTNMTKMNPPLSFMIRRATTDSDDRYILVGIPDELGPLLRYEGEVVPVARFDELEAQLRAAQDLRIASNADVMNGLRRIARAVGDEDPKDLGGVHILAALVEFVIRKREEVEAERERLRGERDVARAEGFAAGIEAAAKIADQWKITARTTSAPRTFFADGREIGRLIRAVEPAEEKADG